MIEIVENGVDMALWDRPAQPKPAPPQFIFVGRLVWWKAVDLLLEAMERVPEAGLRIIGDGPEREKLEAQAANGAVILEAFACRTPAIATDWGGPQGYVTPETGCLVAPSGRAAFIDGLAKAMRDPGADPELAARMGAAGRARVEMNFAWAAKARRMLTIYEGVRRS